MFLAYLVTVKCRENGDVVRRGAGVKDTNVDLRRAGTTGLFQDKTAALNKDLQLSSCERQREEISFLVVGWVGGLDRYILFMPCVRLEIRLCCGLDNSHFHVFIHRFLERINLKRKSGPSTYTEGE